MFPFIGGFVMGSRGAKRISAMSAAETVSLSARQRDDVFELHDRIDRLTLVVAAMWSLLEESGHTQEQLMERMQQLDAADGSMDGQAGPSVAACPSCGAMVASNQPACQFCGSENPNHGPVPRS